MSNKNEVFEYQIDQLRQQVGNNPYKQQCEDLAHEVQSLKNRLRDMSEVVDELMGTITLMNGALRLTKFYAKVGTGRSNTAAAEMPRRSGTRGLSTAHALYRTMLLLILNSETAKWKVIPKRYGGVGVQRVGHTKLLRTVPLSRDANTIGTFTIKALR